MAEALAITALGIAGIYAVMGIVMTVALVRFLKETKRRETLTKGLDEKEKKKK